MKKKQRNEKILIIAAGILLLSITLMIITIPGILHDTSPNANPKSAAILIIAAIVIRLIIFILYIRFIRGSRLSNNNRMGEYLGIGIFLILLGFFYMDGAISFLPHKNVQQVSILMFASTLCDFVSSLMIIVLFFLKPQKLI